MKLVMLVEDEYGNAEVMKLLLESEGYRVTSASNGKAALELLAGEKPAAILADFMMPHMTGGELGTALRASPTLSDIPFVMVSGTHESVVRENFADYDAFVPKPFVAEGLLRLLAHFVDKGRTVERRDPEVERTLRRLLQGIRIPPM